MIRTPHPDDTSHHEDTQRLEAFSDGVFAIATTLLVIDIAVPHVGANENLRTALTDLWPSYFGYAVSFLTIGIIWINHHHMFKDIERVDNSLVALNVLLLLAVAFVPFPTAVLAEYLGAGEHEVAATVAYDATFVVIAVLANALWLYASTGRRLIDEHVSQARVRSRTRRYLVGPALYAVALPLAFASYWAALGVFTALAVFWLLPLNE